MTVRWTNRALAVLAGLAGAEREEIFERLELAAEFPAMYPLRGRGPYAALRYFVVRRKWIVYYRASADDLVVVNLIPARARPL